MLAPPLMISANDIQGTNVVDRQGEDRGEIDQIMIDVDRGHVAYVLLERDGFLGMGGEWVPVPMAALKWVPGQTTGFVLEGSAAQLKEIPALERDELPTRVTGRDLQQLNQRFGVKPYWQEEQTASTERSQ